MRDDKKIEIEMKDQVKEAITWFGEPITKKPVLPANKNLFVISMNSPELDSEKSDIFHSVVQKLLYIIKRARPGIETAILFLCTRVSKSTHDDWMKLCRVLGFLQHAINNTRIIGANSLQDVFTWVDSTYGVHNADLPSHTGGSMLMGTRAIHTRSTKQKLNVKSSTEAEIVTTSKFMPYNVWIRFFGSTRV